MDFDRWKTIDPDEGQVPCFDCGRPCQEGRHLVECVALGRPVSVCDRCFALYNPELP